MLILLNSVGIYIMKEDIKVVVSIRLKDNLIKLLLFVKEENNKDKDDTVLHRALRMMVQETL
jgi:hypothetical protein